MTVLWDTAMLDAMARVDSPSLCNLKISRILRMDNLLLANVSVTPPVVLPRDSVDGRKFLGPVIHRRFVSDYPNRSGRLGSE
jgi:hypothetical protein